jgi:uncharacterized protein YegL
MRTDITVILDRSGSMQSTRDDAMQGFNALVEDQKTAAGEAWLSLVQFDDQYEVNYTETPIQAAPALTPATYLPRGSTALLDAIGRTIDAIGHRLSARPEGDRPDKVIVVIITDGQENASATFTGASVSQKIAQRRDVDKWEFIFVGSNQDAIVSAARMNIPAAQALSFAASSPGTRSAFRAVAGSLSSLRSGQASAFTPEQRADAIDDSPSAPPKKPDAGA